MLVLRKRSGTGRVEGFKTKRELVDVLIKRNPDSGFRISWSLNKINEGLFMDNLIVDVARKNDYPEAL